jgi:hypothetical protein
MHGKTSRINSLAARKKLLLVESNLNRALLAAEVAGIKREIHELSRRAFSTGLLAAGAVQAGSAVKGLFHAFFHRDQKGDEQKKTWLSTLARGARMGTLLWSFLRSTKR